MLSRRDLISLGFSESAIEHRLGAGRLHRVRPGVYAVGWPGVTRERRWMAAVLACGPDAALSHRSAAALWGIGEERGGIEVSIRSRRECRQAGIHARMRPSLSREEIVRHNDIPVTRPARTLLDLATELRPNALERAVNDADKRDLISPDDLREALEEYAGEPGVRALRRLLDRDRFLLSDSDLELHFRPLAAAAGLPPPTTKAMVNGFEVDFYWPGLGLVIETDGLRYHRTPAAQGRDQIRDQTHTAAGLTSLRFSHYQVKHEKARVRNVLMRTVRRLMNAQSG